MTLPAFFDVVEERVKAVAERELEDTIYRAAGCPWIDHWIAHYRGRSPDEVEAAIRRYAPSAATAATPDGLRAVHRGARVADGIRGWQATGQLPAPAAAAAAAPRRLGGRRASPPVPAVARKGRPLDGAASARFGAAFGADLSGVRVHTGAAGQALATRERARAVTVRPRHRVRRGPLRARLGRRRRAARP